MADLATELKHLAKAESDIAAGERRVSAQALLVERLRDGGHETGEAEALLLTLRQTLAAWRGHRDEILRTVARLEGDGLGESAR